MSRRACSLTGPSYDAAQVPGCTCLSVRSDATRTVFEIGANQSFAVYFGFWPSVSAQKTSFRSSVAFDERVGRTTYVKVEIGYAVAAALGGFTMWSSLPAGTFLTVAPASATRRMLG